MDAKVKEEDQTLSIISEKTSEIVQNSNKTATDNLENPLQYSMSTSQNQHEAESNITITRIDEYVNDLQAMSCSSNTQIQLCEPSKREIIRVEHEANRCSVVIQEPFYLEVMAHEEDRIVTVAHVHDYKNNHSQEIDLCEMMTNEIYNSSKLSCKVEYGDIIPQEVNVNKLRTQEAVYDEIVSQETEYNEIELDSQTTENFVDSCTGLPERKQYNGNQQFYDDTSSTNYELFRFDTDRTAPFNSNALRRFSRYMLLLQLWTRCDVAMILCCYLYTLEELFHACLCRYLHIPYMHLSSFGQ